MIGEIDQAESCFERALQQQPGYLSALKNRGTLWIWNGEIERGLRWYEQGLAVDPGNAELHRNLGVIHLLLGNYSQGWSEYRWRWQMNDLKRPSVTALPWTGEDLHGRTIMLYPEQGRGDAIQFVRSTLLAKQRGARVILKCARDMVPLFSSAPGVDRLVAHDVTPNEPVDFHASLIEVVDVHYTQTGEIPYVPECFDGGGYLTVSQPLIEYWDRWLEVNTTNRRVGINWQGNPKHHADVYRSIPLKTLAPLSQVDGVDLVNLQFGFGAEQMESCDFADQIVRLPEHVDSTDGAFTDTAAIIKNLDMVVTTDTAVAHLAGAVGTDVLLMLGRVPDWRWLTEGETTSWYPSMKLIRQQQLGTWDDVVAKVVETLSL